MTNRSSELGWAKGFPPNATQVAIEEVASLGWSLDDGLSTPLAVIDDDALTHNIAVMSDYCAAEDVHLAPHGKTTMSPQLIRRQLAAGAWGMTAANVNQAAIMIEAGAERVIIANECVDSAAIGWVWDLHRSRPDVALYVFADSLAAVHALHRECATRAAVDQRSATPLRVVVEVGAAGGRAGARTLADTRAVAAAIQESPWLRLSGVGGFEGVLGEDRSPESLDRVRGLLVDIRAAASVLAGSDAGEPAEPFLVTAGGSAYFDLVVEALSPTRFSVPVELVLRSGCYLLHDHGVYRDLSPFAATPRSDFRPALTVWTTVVSVPERELAIIDAGKRDLAVEHGVTVLHGRRQGEEIDVAAMRVLRFNDQHGYLSMRPGSLAVGDRLQLGTSHPCLTFDKWRVIPIVDGGGRVLSVVQTFF